MKLDTVPVFDPWLMTVVQLKRCIYLCNVHVRECQELHAPFAGYLNNWRSDRVRFIRALESKLLLVAAE